MPAVPTVPARRDYQPEIQPQTVFALPFVRWPKGGRPCHWHVPPSDDYGLACQIGREYAGHLAQYLKDNPFWVDSCVLNAIVRAMDFTDESAARGYWVGFFGYLERLVYLAARRIDVFADLDAVQARYAELEARSAARAAEADEEDDED